MTKLLFLSANQLLKQRYLSIDEELREIREELQKSTHGCTIEIEARGAVRANDWLKEINRYQPHSVHFSGHGNEGGRLMLLGNDGNLQPAPPQAITNIFHTLKGNIRLVFLNACHSRQQAASIAEEIDCAIGMDGEIRDKAARIFVGTFYHFLGNGESVQQAFDLGIQALQLDPEVAEAEKVPHLAVRPGVNASEVRLIEAGQHIAPPILHPALKIEQDPPATSTNAAAQQSKSEPAFIVCIHHENDKEDYKQLEIQLSWLTRQGRITLWSRENILGGDITRNEWQAKLSKAHIIIILVSADLLYDHENELAIAEQQKGKGARIIPIILKYSGWHNDKRFKGLTTYPRNGKPIPSGKKGEMFATIADDIQIILEQQ